MFVSQQASWLIRIFEPTNPHWRLAALSKELGPTRDQDRLSLSAARLSALPWHHRARPQGTLRSSPLRAARVDAGGSPATAAPGIRLKDARDSFGKLAGCTKRCPCLGCPRPADLDETNRP
jgi:hypothetical protein